MIKFEEVLSTMSNGKLVELAVAVMGELKRRDELVKNDKKNTVSFSQDTRNGTIVRYEDGTPLDRSGWFYLPFIPGSANFQPARIEGVSLYREVIEDGKVLKITRPGGEIVARVRVGGQKHRKVAAGGAMVSGQLSEI